MLLLLMWKKLEFFHISNKKLLFNNSSVVILKTFFGLENNTFEIYYISLFLVFSGIAEGCLIQPEKEIWRTTEQDAVLTCTVSSHCPAGGWQYEWFVFKEHSHHHLNLSVSRSKYTLVGASLHISPLTVNDSGIYHCAAVHAGKPAKGAQHVGLGTTLAVTGECLLTEKTMILKVRHRCLDALIKMN